MSLRRASYTIFPCLPSIVAKSIAISLRPTLANHDEYKKARPMIEGSLINQICISKNVVMSCAAVENDTHSLKDMPNSFFAIDRWASNLDTCSSHVLTMLVRDHFKIVVPYQGVLIFDSPYGRIGRSRDQTYGLLNQQ